MCIYMYAVLPDYTVLAPSETCPMTVGTILHRIHQLYKGDFKVRNTIMRTERVLSTACGVPVCRFALRAAHFWGVSIAHLQCEFERDVETYDRPPDGGA